MNSKRNLLIFLISFAFGLALCFALYWLFRPDATAEGKPQQTTKQPSPPPVVEPPAPAPTPPPVATTEPNPLETPMARPEELMKNLASSLTKPEFLEQIAQNFDSEKVPQETMAKLRELLAAGKLKNLQPRLLGESTLQGAQRWVLTIPDAPEGQRELLVEIAPKNGAWTLQKLFFTPQRPDALSTADGFLQAVIRQDFGAAKSYVQPKSVSNPTLVGLILIFEDGVYRLPPNHALRLMLERADFASYLVGVQSDELHSRGEFSLNLCLTEEKNWKIAEVNLDHLLSTFAKNQGSDESETFVPLVKNPKGGDLLLINFAFDKDELTSRAKRQVALIAKVLTQGQKITLTGYTDGLGSKDYNQSLSMRRAEIVRDALIAAGITKEQIILKAEGMRNPLRPNVTQTGADNPEGRKINRRTEIYLDF